MKIREHTDHRALADAIKAEDEIFDALTLGLWKDGHVKDQPIIAQDAIEWEI